MNKEEISTFSSVIIAFSTFMGVGSAIAYYLKKVIEKIYNFNKNNIPYLL